MDTIEFTKGVPIEQVATIFRDFFEAHMVAYDMLRGVEFNSLNSISMNAASIIYSVRLLDNEDKERLVKALNSKAASLVIYGNKYTPKVYLNGDLLCIEIDK